MAGMIVLDASVLIAHWDTENSFNQRATSIVLHTTDRLAMHPITVAEATVAPIRAGRELVAESAVRRLRIHVIDIPADFWIELARLRASTTLRMPDICVLWAAQKLAATLATFDRRLARTATEFGLTVMDGN